MFHCCLNTNAEWEYKSVTSGNTWLLWAKLWRSWRMGSGRSGGGSSPLEPLCASCTAGHDPVGAPLTSEWHSRLVPNQRPFKQSAFVSHAQSETISLRRALQYHFFRYRYELRVLNFETKHHLDVFQKVYFEIFDWRFNLLLNFVWKKVPMVTLYMGRKKSYFSPHILSQEVMESSAFPSQIEMMKLKIYKLISPLKLSKSAASWKHWKFQGNTLFHFDCYLDGMHLLDGRND